MKKENIILTREEFICLIMENFNENAKILDFKIIGKYKHLTTKLTPRKK